MGRPWRPSLCFFWGVTGTELMDCITKSDQFLPEKLVQPLYVWVEVGNIRKIPGNVFKALLRAGRLRNVPSGLIVIGPTAYQIMVVRLAAITFWGIDFKPTFVASTEEGHAGLKKMLGAAAQ